MADPQASMDDDAFEASLSTEEDTVVEPEEFLEESTEEDAPSLEEEDKTSEDDSTDEEKDTTDEETTEEEEADTETEETDDVTTEETETEAPVEDALSELYKPFKAAGRDFQVKSMDEAKKLMSMGVDYSNKLQGFKQHRTTIKTLETNEIDADKLNYLIDLSKGDSSAITRLLQEHKVDPDELDLEEDLSYTPKDHSVSEATVELDDVLSRIQETTAFSTTSDIVTNQWDALSKQAIFAKPEYLESLNTQVANGTFDRVMQEVSRARVFGGLRGLNDLEAYNQVGAELQKQGEFDKPAPVVETKPKSKVTNTDRKLRASSSKATPKSKAPIKSWASMDDEEFEKLLEGN
jgi:hypothetical protein